MNASLRNFQIAALVLVLAVSALLASGKLRLPGRDPLQSLGQDVQRTLNTFWANQDSKVASSGTAEAAELVVTPATPGITRPRQLAWSRPVVEFVIARYPEVKVSRLELSGVPEAAQDKELARRPAGFQDLSFFEEARSQVLQRNLQLELDAKFGKGSCLALVDVVATQGPAALSAPGEVSSLESRESAVPRQRRAQDNSIAPRRQANPQVLEPQVQHLEARLLVLESSQVEPAEALARTSLELQEARGDSLRTLTLGPRL